MAEGSTARRGTPSRLSVRALAAGLMATAMGCWAPADPGVTRPRAVPATRFEQRDIQIDGMRLRYIDVPAAPGHEDRLPLMLIHGHTSRIEEYDELIAELHGERRVLVVDLPGSGYSAKPARGYTLEFYEDTLLHFLDAVHVAKANLAGGSMGGNLTLRLGYRAPERFERLVPWAPGSAWEAHPVVASLLRRIASYPLFWPIVKGQSRYWYRPDFALRDTLLERTFAYYDEVMCDGFVRMYFGMAADQVGTSLFPMAPSIRQPTLLLWGDHDHGGNMGVGVQRLHGLLPRNELVVFKDAGHALASEIPAQVAARINEFLGRPEATLP